MQVTVQVVKRDDVKVEINPDKMITDIGTSSQDLKEVRASSITTLLKGKVMSELGVSFSNSSQLWDYSVKNNAIYNEVEYHGSHSWFSDEKIRDATPEEQELFEAYQEFDRAYCKFRLAQDKKET